MSNARAFHYTTGNKLALIARSNSLTPTNVMVAPKEKAILWFSANPVYEPTAVKLVMTSETQARRPSVEELHEIIGIFRFGIPAKDARLIPFNKLALLAHIPKRDVTQMIASGMRIGATPVHWTGSFSSIPLSELEFEAWNGERWVAGQLQDAIDRIRSNGREVMSVSAAALGLTNAY